MPQTAREIRKVVATEDEAGNTRLLGFCCSYRCAALRVARANKRKPVRVGMLAMFDYC